MQTIRKVCKRCVLDQSDPNIEFNEQGICNYCQKYDRELRLVKKSCTPDELEKNIDLIKREGVGKDYDAIVGLSGGVDSTYVLYMAVKVYGLRVLALHVDAGWNSEIAVRNIHRAVDELDVDLHTHVIDWEMMRDVQAAFFRASVVNCDIPQDHCFKAVQFKVAKKLGIRFFVSGRNVATDAMMPPRWVWSNDDGYHLKKIHKKYGKRKLRGFPLYSAIYGNLFIPHLSRYTDVRLLDYIDYKRIEAKKLVTSELDWTDYGGKHYESVFTEFYQGYYLPRKFGFDKRKAHLSGLINNGEISRDEALHELSHPPLPLEREKELKAYVLKKLGFSASEWEEIMSMEEVPHTSYPNRIWLVEHLKTFGRSVRYRVRGNR